MHAGTGRCLTVVNSEPSDLRFRRRFARWPSPRAHSADVGRVAVIAMAERQDLDFTYSLTDRVIRLSLGELADFSGAKYDGDFSLSLEQAQRRKHDYVAEQIGIGPGARVLDLGCGWGGLLKYVRDREALGLGVTLSSAQAAACRRHGLNVHLHDARTVTCGTFGAFDAVASLGAFEHFCSPEDHTAGRQEDVYRGLFERVADVLPNGGRFYLQTMVFGPNMVPLEQVSTSAPRNSDAWILALLRCQFPGSWLPSGQDQIVRCAEPHFGLVSSVSGRLDYIETINQWNRLIGSPGSRRRCSSCASSRAGSPTAISGSRSPRA